MILAGCYELSFMISAITCWVATTPASAGPIPPVLPHDMLALSAIGSPECSNMPTGDWPGANANESNKAWTAAKQPQPWECWPMNMDNTPGKCWNGSVMADTAAQWPGLCKGLQKKTFDSLEPWNGSIHTACAGSCASNPHCSVWQMLENFECWQGLSSSDHCQHRSSEPDFRPMTAQRLLHGNIRVLKQLTGMEILGLRQVEDATFFWTTEAAMTTCASYCYSNILCQYWQFGPTGCWIEDPDAGHSVSNPLTLSDVSTTSEFAKKVVGGEYIQHLCPAERVFFG